jgi:hypothetical protein
MMRSFFLSGVICSILCLVAIATVDGASCGCGGATSGGEYNWWSLQGQDCGGGDCGYPCRTPGARACNPCATGCRPMTCHDRTFCGPLSGIFALFTRNSWCGGSCGERYWGDFYSDPPDFCDPCDRCGNYTGRVDGYSGGSGGYGRGCNCSGGSQGMMEQSVPMEGKVISQGDRVTRQIPTPAAKARKPSNNKTYK